VRDHVPVRVPGEPTRVIEADAAEHERDAFRKRVRVDAQPDPQGHASTSGSSSSDAMRIASAGGSCR